ncbi:MAG: transcriptional regulator, TetR family [Phenylobacterium sp.]|jgi:TetR/AcrR family transcriptional repressor of mexJK operon|nr:transcriptional regulator, TetR family [Phenylobacterium sp.]
MARVAGQIDLSKNEAILDAAIDVLGERGIAAPMEAIARRACVSKQTIYNHYGSKADLVRAIAARRVHEMTAPLETPEGLVDPAQALAGFARVLLGIVLKPGGLNLYRTAMISAFDMPDIARAFFEAGPKESRLKLARFLALETQAGRLACPDPVQAAEFFAGMVIGSQQSAALLGVPISPTAAQIDQIAVEAAARFIRAYAP